MLTAIVHCKPSIIQKYQAISSASGHIESSVSRAVYMAVPTSTYTATKKHRPSSKPTISFSISVLLIETSQSRWYVAFFSAIYLLKI